MSGSSTPPPHGIVDIVAESDVRVQEVHDATLWKRIIKEYLIQKGRRLPWNTSSSKGNRTKLSYFIQAVDHAPIVLFKQVETSCFRKLLIRWPRLLWSMENLSGAQVFGTCCSRTCPFELLHAQEKWDRAALKHERSAMMAFKSSSKPDSGFRACDCCATPRECSSRIAMCSHRAAGRQTHGASEPVEEPGQPIIEVCSSWRSSTTTLGFREALFEKLDFGKLHFGAGSSVLKLLGLKARSFKMKLPSSSFGKLDFWS